MAVQRPTIKSSVRKKADENVESKLSLKVKAMKDKQTRVEILQHISDATGLKRVEVEAVFTEMAK
ncbi:MAG: hypothetical protein AB7V32_06400, partial [Candidatus Berkiella sp.]